MTHLLLQVLQPLNEKAAKVLTENSDLLETDDMEPLLLQLIAHVYANRVGSYQARRIVCKHIGHAFRIPNPHPSRNYAAGNPEVLGGWGSRRGEATDNLPRRPSRVRPAGVCEAQRRPGETHRDAA